MAKKEAPDYMEVLRKLKSSGLEHSPEVNRPVGNLDELPTLEERVAKAPVKMMLPTGTLILPAMLLLVMGPILLELAGGF